MGAVLKATKNPLIRSSYGDVNVWDLLQLGVCPEDSRLNGDSDKTNRRDLLIWYSVDRKRQVLDERSRHLVE